MRMFRVRYVGPWDLVINAESSIDAELEAANQTDLDCWTAEEIEPGDEDEDA